MHRITDFMEKHYDVVIVGCGMAGALAGLTALKENLSVCIVEKKKREYIGTKICGELMPQETVQWLQNEFSISIDFYPLKGLVICTPPEHKGDRSLARLKIEEPLCTIDRWQFGQAMVDELVKRGADILCGKVESSLYDGGIIGVKTKDDAIYGNLTIDCSGSFSVLRDRTSFASPVNPRVFGMAYKEEIEVEEPLSLEYAMLVLNKKDIPSGYMWCFPKNEHILNTGAGGLMQGKPFFRRSLTKVLETHSFTVKERTKAGFGVLPLRHPLSSKVGPGLLVCGDAAFQVNPLTGEGIAPALTAGYRAGKVAAQAVQSNDTSVEGMWHYNQESAKNHGAVCGPLCILRDFLVSLSSEELTFLLNHVISSEDLQQLENDWSFPPLERMVAVALASLKKPGLLYRTYRVLKKMMKVRTLYQSYPETPEGFLQWRRQLHSCFE